MSSTSSLKRSEEVVVPSWPFALTNTAVPLALVAPLTPAMKAAVWVAGSPIRMVLLSSPGAVLPMSMLPVPATMLPPALEPSATLPPPVAWCRALKPTAVLLLVVATLKRADAPTAVLELPVELVHRAELPSALLDDPVERPSWLKGPNPLLPVPLAPEPLAVPRKRLPDPAVGVASAK